MRIYDVCKESDSSLIPIVQQCNLLSPNLFFIAGRLDIDFNHIGFYFVGLLSPQSKNEEDIFTSFVEMETPEVRTFLSLFRNSTKLVEWLKESHYYEAADIIKDPNTVFLKKLTTQFRKKVRDVKLNDVEYFLEQFPKYKQHLIASVVEDDLIAAEEFQSRTWDVGGIGGCRQDDENNKYLKMDRYFCQHIIRVSPPLEPYEKLMRLLSDEKAIENSNPSNQQVRPCKS